MSRPTPARVDFSDVSIRDKLRQKVDPDKLVDRLITIAEDPSATHRDQLAAIKMIMDRRDGLPVGMVVTGHVSIDHAFGELPEAALDQLQEIVSGYQSQLTLASGEEGYDDDGL